MDKRNIFLYLLTLLALFNVYVWWKLVKAFFYPKPAHAAILLSAILCMLMMPFLRAIPGARAILPERVLMFPWCWMAISFWMMTFFLAMDIWNGGNILLHRFFMKIPLHLISAKREGIITLALTAICILWSVCESYQIQHKIIKIHSPYLTEPIRIALLSDLHLGASSSQIRNKKAARLISKIQPDLILSAGDLIDGVGERIEEEMNCLDRQLPPGIPRYAVMGNHECYTGLSYCRKLHKAAKFEMLENRFIDFGSQLRIYGASDCGHAPAAPVILPEHPQNRFVLYLCHQPYLPQNPQNADLQLSGHTHGGQIFPFQLLIPLQFPWKSGKLLTTPSGMKLYISRGTGVWGMPFRLFAPPEITEIQLLPENMGR